MKDVCALNQNITDKFKHLDDEQYQQEYAEHCRKINIIDSYEDEIKEVLFLSSGCVETGSHSYKEYGLGISPDYINFERLIDKIQYLRATRLKLDYLDANYFNGGYFKMKGDEDIHSLRFLDYRKNKDYRDHLIEKVNKYSKEFYNKEYFLRLDGSIMDCYSTLVTKDETWSMEYLRHPETLHSWMAFTIVGLIPILGWLYILYSMYEAVKIYLKHRGVTK